MNRRELFAVATLGLTALAGVRFRSENPAPVLVGPPRDVPRRSVVVIGAGIAGMTAAQSLVRAGHDVTVLEARDRVGGRIQTDNRWGAPVDLGAAWMHGHNPVWAALDSEGVSWAAETDFGSVALFDHDGSRVSTLAAALPALRAEAIFPALERAASRLHADRSVADLLDEIGAGEGFSGRSARLLDFMMYAAIHQEFAIPPEQLSALQLPDYFSYPGPEYLPSEGMGVVWPALGLELPVQTGMVVEHVRITDRQVEVRTTEGRITADQCICAVPLGVLQRNGITFEPALPMAVQQAVNRLVVGDFYKLALRFPEPFWDGEADFTGSVAQAGQHGAGRHVAFLHLDRAHGEPVVAMLAGTHLARELESAGPSSATKLALDRLRTAYGTIPDPLDAMATSWRLDPHSNGAYANYGVGAGPDDVRAFQRLHLRRLTFAGEHTSIRVSSTVHGAYESGRRAARTLTEV